MVLKTYYLKNKTKNTLMPKNRVAYIHMKKNVASFDVQIEVIK